MLGDGAASTQKLFSRRSIRPAVYGVYRFARSELQNCFELHFSVLYFVMNLEPRRLGSSR